MQILLPVAVFTIIVLSLTTLVLASRRRLEPSGIVNITVNGRQSFDIEAGRHLLQSLADHGMYLPAACGGRGTCGQCRIRVVAGTGLITPADELHLGPKDIAAGERLACMLKVVEPLEIRVPDDVLTAQRIEGVVKSNRCITTYLKELTLELDETFEFDAGDYVIVEAPPHHLAFSEFEIDTAYRPRWEESELFNLESDVPEAVSRAYSIGSPPQNSRQIVLIVRIALPPPGTRSGTPPGKVSSWLFRLKPGDRVSMQGPFGDFHIRDSDAEIVLIGGGAGVSPLRSIALDLLARGSQRKIALWYGARNRDELCYSDEFSAAAEKHKNFDYQFALSDEDANSDWPGHRGFIHTVVYEQYLRNHSDPTKLEYYLCGPPLMSAAVFKMLGELGVPPEQIFFDDFGT